ncbi:MAG TPA: family 43 glycosylhydrolase [Bacillota bacterium]|nr:family 43 glycosylhydrolase [Bacillota bacterium]
MSKKIILISLLVIVFCFGLTCWGAAPVNPVLKGYYADPEITVFGSTYYIYPTTDGFASWSGTYFKCFSSTDLVNWSDRGTILDLGPGVSWSDSQAWAPCIVQKGSTYYYYFCASAQIGVATSTSPTGPFTDALGRPMVTTNQYGCQSIDPDVFIDDDGQAYMYFGQGKCMVVKLNADMKSFNGTPQNITPSGYNEGSNVFKRNGIYYLLWSENDTRSEDYRVAYGTSSSPLGPFTKKAVILQKNLTLGIKGTGHNSVVKVPNADEWYICYHRFAIPNGDGTHRETCIDRMYFNSDGTIQSVVPTLGSAPTPVPVTYYKIRNVGMNLYMDGMGRTTNGSNCGQYASSTSYNQHWVIEAAGSYVKIKNRATGLYLDGMGRTSNGSACGQYGSSTSNNQQWTKVTVGSYVKFKNRATGLCIDGMGRTTNGADLGQYADGSSTNQQWALVQQ